MRGRDMKRVMTRERGGDGRVKASRREEDGKRILFACFFRCRFSQSFFEDNALLTRIPSQFSCLDCLKMIHRRLDMIGISTYERIQNDLCKRIQLCPNTGPAHRTLIIAISR